MTQPRSAPAGYGPAPAEEPLGYPGTVPHGSCLLVDDTLLPMTARNRRRLPQWRVALGGHRLPGDDPAAEMPPLGYVLLRHNEAPMGQRYPVLAVGSGASPARLWQTFREHDASVVLPMVLAAEVHNVAIGVSAHIALPGYVPVTPIVAPGSVTRLFVLWPDRSQVAALDHGEPHYHRVLLPGGDFPVVLPSGEHLAHCYAYVSRHGHLCAPDTTPLLMPDPVSANGAPLRPEHDLLRELLARDDELRELLGPDPAAFVQRAAARPAVRESARQLFRARNWVGQSPELDAPIASAWGTAERAGRAKPIGYDGTPPLHPVPANAFRVLPSSDDVDRAGQATVRVSPPVAAKLGQRHVLVTPVGEAPSARIGALARAVEHAELEDDATAEVDLVVRTAIGVEVGEDVELAPVAMPRNRLAGVVSGHPRHILCRVQPADLTTAESRVCLLDELSMDLLGVRGGEAVIVEGGADLSGTINQVRLEAFRISDEVRHRRESLHGGDFGRRYPSALDALGVFPDLPWIFLDAGTRTALGLGAQDLATVRVHRR